jgi:membrane-bound lytic murein transglycosylase D
MPLVELPGMPHNGFSTTWMFLLAAVAVLSVTILGAAPLAGDFPTRLVSSEAVAPPPAELPVELPPIVVQTRMRPYLSSHRLPAAMTFANEPVPIQMWQVRERLEYEFYRFLADEGDSIILAKRTGRCFPPAERMLAEAGMPDDLKYILLVESKCISAAYSKAKASGPWQFIPRTGRMFALENNVWKDDRRNLELSTEAAIKYLKKLHDIFGDWLLAMAAYNAGETRIIKAMREQRVKDYWRLHYVNETMRYVPRVIAVKEIFSQPEKYLGLAKGDLYSPLNTEIVSITITEKQRHLAAVAEQYGTYFLELKLLNPEISKDYLPRGVHRIKIPRRPEECPTVCLKTDKKPH